MSHPPPPLATRREWLLTTGLPIAFIVALVIALWLPFGFKTTGLVEEWGILGLLRQGHSLFFVDQNSVLSAHAIRPFTVLPHAIAYTLDPNSFLWFNLQQIIFFIGKGVFAFLLVRRLLPHHHLLAFSVGVLFIIHPSDNGLFTFRAIHVHAAVIMFMAAIYLLLRIWDTSNYRLIPLMWFCLLISLFMYELIFSIAVIIPALLLFKNRGLSRKVAIFTALWYLVPLLAGVRLIFVLITTPTTELYQTNIMGRLDAGRTAEAFIKMYSRSFFTGWQEALNDLRRLESTPSYILIAALVSSGFVGISWLLLPIDRQQPIISRSRYFKLFVIGILFILFGFLPFLLTSTHQFIDWRTYYVSAFGASICFLLAMWAITHSRHTFIFVSASFIGLATAHGLQQHQHYHELSLRQQRFLGQVLEAAPRLLPGTNVIMIDRTNWMRDEWTFGFSENLLLTLRYLYEDPSLSWLTCYELQTEPNVSNQLENCTFGENSVEYREPNMQNRSVSLSYNQVLVFEYSYQDELELVNDLDQLLPSEISTINYEPTSLISTDNPAINTVFNIFHCWPIELCTSSLQDLIATAPLRLEFDQTTSIGTGWRSPEVTSNNLTFCWTVAEEATILLRLEPTNDYRIHLAIFTSITPERPNTLSTAINDQVFALDRLNQNEFTGIIPASALEPEIDYLEFRVPQLDQVPGTDVYLGLAVDWLTLEPINGE